MYTIKIYICRILKSIEGMLEKDISDNKAIGNFGADAILSNMVNKNVRILTHCNTGSLATAGYGTALGVIRALHERNRIGNFILIVNNDYISLCKYITTYNFFHIKLILCIFTKISDQVYCTETRPYNQGARLTAYELVYEKIPSTLIVDSMVSILLKTKNITAIVVGADRVR